MTWKDARCNVEAGRRVVVVSGSGRTADILAEALKRESCDEFSTEDFVDERGKISSGFRIDEHC